MTTPMDRLLDMRRKAVGRVFENKYKARARITVGSATCENAAGAGPVYDRLAALIRESGAKDVALGRVGCTGKCDMEPVVTVVRTDEMPEKYNSTCPASSGGMA